MAEPGGEGEGLEFAGGEGKGVEDGLFLGGMEDPTIQFEKQGGRHQAGALVAIEERMVFDDAVGVTGGEIEEIRVFVVEELQRTRKGGVEETFVADAAESAEAGEQLLLDGADHLFVQPGRFVHLASSLRALR